MLAVQLPMTTSARPVAGLLPTDTGNVVNSQTTGEARGRHAGAGKVQDRSSAAGITALRLTSALYLMR